VTAQAIFLAELRETQRTLDVKVASMPEDQGILLAIQTRLAAISEAWDHYQAQKIEVSRETMRHLREELRSLIVQIRSLDLENAVGA
jgi:hypothetical protein